MQISLSDHFTYKKLLTFTMPSILMMVFTSIYNAVDGFFVSNYAGETPLAAVNLIFPLWIICSSFGFVFGAGGTAYVSKTLGEGNRKKANESFSLFIYTSIVIGIVVSILGYIFAPMVSKMLGAEGELLEQSVLYIRILFLLHPFMMLQIEFHEFCVTAEKPKLGFYVTLAGGAVNIILDALLVGYYKLGIMGAAIATDISVFIGGGVPLLYFTFKNSSLLRLCKCSLDFKALFKAITNGISELVNSISGAIVGFLYNYQLMIYIGEKGVAAFGVLMYVYFFFQSIFIGYAFGSAPLFGFNFGARKASELKNLLSKSLKLILFFSLCMFFIGAVFSSSISSLFTSYDESLFKLTKFALEICTFAFLFFGFNIFGSAFFTALSDGITSAKIAGFRSLLIEPAIIMILPKFFGKDSIWWSVVIAEVVCILVTAFYFVKKRELYLNPKPNY